MSKFALTQTDQKIFASDALKQIDYRCIECLQIVRVRKGSQRIPHFYHLKPTPHCIEHQKGAIHVSLQKYFLDNLPQNTCTLEHRFPEINRIADVAWISEKIIFEIQYSPITSEEVIQRNEDYQSIGWKVVWILHDHQFNQKRVSDAELALQGKPHYFSNFDSSGQGIIYDQSEDILERNRKYLSPPLPLSIQTILPIPNSYSYPSKKLEQRIKDWPFCFSGDCIHLLLSGSLNLQPSYKKDRRNQGVYEKFKKGCRILFRLILEWFCSEK